MTSPARFLPLLTVLTLGCGAGAAPITEFVAYGTDFAGFHDWSSAPAMPAPTLPPIDGGDGVAGVDGGTPTDGGIHTLPLTDYWNHAPPSGSTKFPVGTIIIKETDQADPTARQVFAMVKRGADFNPSGAVGWEWFELTNVADGSVAISWRGFGPKTGTGDIYGGNPFICNDCHGVAVSNDYVWSAALQLANF
jgi:hypothetical protein